MLSNVTECAGKHTYTYNRNTRNYSCLLIKVYNNFLVNSNHEWPFLALLQVFGSACRLKGPKIRKGPAASLTEVVTQKMALHWQKN